ncbi:MAG TPA: hypothetical protein VF370_05530 [Candidatus Cryosericum sp.]|jgi:hypothetical protein
MQGEHVLGALPVQWHKSLFNITPWTIVVTDARIIVARLTPEIQKQAVDAQVQEQGGGFLKRMAVAATSGFTMHKRYLTMDPEAVLTETPENWWVDAHGVSQVTVTEGRWISDQHRHRKQNDHQLLIVTQQGKFSYTFAPLSMNAADAANLLAQVFGTTVKLR